jgi:predicted nucleotidyltransferase
VTDAWLGHHRATIDRAVDRLRSRDGVLGVLVGGSIAHGFATASSDVDLLIVVSDAEWERRLTAGDVTELDVESATYEGGYVDIKYTSVGFIRDVAERGSEQARFAFDGVTIAFSAIDDLKDELSAAARYPIEGRDERIRAFHAQLEYWRWMFAEGDRSENAYAKALAAPHVVLFSGRLILAHNAVLYPGYKWLLRVLGDVPEQPPGLMPAIDSVVRAPNKENVDALFDLVAGWRDWGVEGQSWGGRFMADTELAWIEGRPPIADL